MRFVQSTIQYLNGIVQDYRLTMETHEGIICGLDATMALRREPLLLHSRWNPNQAKATLMLESIGVGGGGGVGIATVTASVSVKVTGLPLASTVWTEAVTLATPLATAVTNPLLGSSVTIAAAASSSVKAGVGIGPVKGWPNWSKPEHRGGCSLASSSEGNWSGGWHEGGS